MNQDFFFIEPYEPPPPLQGLNSLVHELNNKASFLMKCHESNGPLKMNYDHNFSQNIFREFNKLISQKKLEKIWLLIINVNRRTNWLIWL